MVIFADGRIPIVSAPAAAAGPDDVVLTDRDMLSGPGVVRLRGAEAPSHMAGCACCVPRGALAQALGALFLARARGEVAFFRRVIADLADPAPLQAALRDDPVVSSRYRAG